MLAVVTFAKHVATVIVDNGFVQGHLPIAEQEESGRIATENVRLLNCWLGVSTKERIGNTFCVSCEYLGQCKALYRHFDGTRDMHPASLARRIFTMFNIESDYLNNEE